MIATLLRISRLSLRRDRVAQTMAFVLPIGFFSIFALIFGRPQVISTSRLDVAVADGDRSDASAWLVETLKGDSTLRVADSLDAKRGGGAITRERAEAMVKAGDADVAIAIPEGWGRTFPDLAGVGSKVEILNDPSNPVARHLANGALQRAGGRMMSGATGGGGAGGGASGGGMMPVPSEVRDVLGDPKQNGRMVAYYAAGIAVMFLLFSASSGGGALLDEQDSGTLERVLGTRAGMNGLLAGKWVHLTLVGATQIVVMFVWAMLAFRLDLVGHLPGFALVTAFTAMAAGAFGLVLATLSRTRQQLGSIATLLILSMSALGGSMFPRFLMSEGMQKVGLATFNAWALDGYLKVFWREAPLASLLPQVGVLATMTVAFLALARVFARRWERG